MGKQLKDDMQKNCHACGDDNNAHTIYVGQP